MWDEWLLKGRQRFNDLQQEASHTTPDAIELFAALDERIDGLAGSVDFFGLNYYFRYFVRFAPGTAARKALAAASQRISTPAPDEFTYTISVEMETKRHTIRISDTSMIDALRPLLEELFVRTRPGRPQVD